MNVTPQDLVRLIEESVVAVLKANNYAIVRNADTSFSSDERDAAFARECGRNAAQVVLAAQDEADEDTYSATTYAGPRRSATEVL